MRVVLRYVMSDRGLLGKVLLKVAGNMGTTALLQISTQNEYTTRDNLRVKKNLCALAPCSRVFLLR